MCHCSVTSSPGCFVPAPVELDSKRGLGQMESASVLDCQFRGRDTRRDCYFRGGDALALGRRTAGCFIRLI
jgi:hypothetical protein